MKQSIVFSWVIRHTHSFESVLKKSFQCVEKIFGALKELILIYLLGKEKKVSEYNQWHPEVDKKISIVTCHQNTIKIKQPALSSRMR